MNLAEPTDVLPGTQLTRSVRSEFVHLLGTFWSGQAEPTPDDLEQTIDTCRAAYQKGEQLGDLALQLQASGAPPELVATLRALADACNTHHLVLRDTATHLLPRIETAARIDALLAAPTGGSP